MTPEDCEALEAPLAQMCAVHEKLADYHPGVCVLHLEAAIATLESHLHRGRVSILQALRHDHSSGVAL